MKPSDPDDTGSLHGDCFVWATGHLEELDSPVGRALLRELVAGSTRNDHAARCGEDINGIFEFCLARTRSRVDAVPAAITSHALVDPIAAPLVSVTLFDIRRMTRDEGGQMVLRCLAGPRVDSSQECQQRSGA